MDKLWGAHFLGHITLGCVGLIDIHHLQNSEVGVYMSLKVAVLSSRRRRFTRIFKEAAFDMYFTTE